MRSPRVVIFFAFVLGHQPLSRGARAEQRCRFLDPLPYRRVNHLANPITLVASENEKRNKLHVCTVYM